MTYGKEARMTTRDKDGTFSVRLVLPVDLDFRPIDLSLENRRVKGMPVYDDAVEAMRATRISLKYPTVTENESPNAAYLNGSTQLWVGT